MYNMQSISSWPNGCADECWWRGPYEADGQSVIPTLFSNS